MTMPLDEVRNISVQTTDEPLVITVNVPGPQGPPGVFRLGTVITTGPGSSASASVAVGDDGIQVINLTIPRGDTGAMGSLTIGTVTSSVNPSATITGSPGSQQLNLVLPKGDQGPSGPAGAQGIQGIQGPQGLPGTNGQDGKGIQVAGQVATYSALPTGLTSADAGKAWIVTADGKMYIWSGTSFPANGSGQTFVGPAGPANTLTIGTVTTGAAGSSANASVSGTAPNQTLNLTIPTGAAGPANTLSIGTVTTGAAGSSATATITGSAPNQTLNFSIPKGTDGATGPVGPTGPQGPPGQGVLVLGASDAVPAGTPANTVIYRPAVKTSTYYWGSGTSYPASGVGAGDTYFHTGLNALMRFNGNAWRHLGSIVVADSTARNTMSTNWAGILYPGLQVRQTSDTWTYEWTGSAWSPVWYGSADPTWINVGAAGAPAFQNGWVNYNSGFSTARFMKTSSGMVIVEGLVMSGTINSAVFTLPVGYRPSGTLIFAPNSSGTSTRLDVTAVGAVWAQAGANGYFSLGGVMFPAEA
jgi:hypothetical protein